jgi:hypothetical protein
VRDVSNLQNEIADLREELSVLRAGSLRSDEAGACMKPDLGDYRGLAAPLARPHRGIRNTREFMEINKKFTGF